MCCVSSARRLFGLSPPQVEDNRFRGTLGGIGQRMKNVTPSGRKYRHLGIMSSKPLQHIVWCLSNVEKLGVQSWVTTCQFGEFELGDHLSTALKTLSLTMRCTKPWILTNRKNADDAINGYTDYALAFFRRPTADEPHTNVHSSLLAEPYDLGPSAPIPAH